MADIEKTKQDETAEAEMKREEKTDGAMKPILPGEEYASEVAKEDPEELEKARRRVMAILRIKAKGLNGDALAQQIQPMVYSMSISDCNNLYNTLSKHGIMGLARMAAKHNKEEKRK